MNGEGLPIVYYWLVVLLVGLALLFLGLLWIWLWLRGRMSGKKDVIH